MTVAPTPAAGGGAPQYRRLPGRSRGLMGSASLWLAADHVLLVQSRGYVETYRRFYFRDVQALLLRRTAAAWLWAAVAAVPLALMMLGAGLAQGIDRTVWLACASPLALVLLVHGLRGPSCVCHVRTAVEQTELPALRRLRPARRTCERLRALVEEAQGRVAIEVLARGAPGDPAAVGSVPPRLVPAPAEAGLTAPAAAAGALGTPASAAGVLPMPALPHGVAPAPRAGAASREARWHAPLFALLAADTVLSTAQVVAPGQLLDAGALLLGIVEFLIAIAALVEGRRKRLDQGLRRVTLASLIYVCAAFVGGWVTSVVGGIQAAIQGAPPHPSLSAEWLAIGSIPVTAVLAVWGFVAVRRARGPG